MLFLPLYNMKKMMRREFIKGMAAAIMAPSVVISKSGERQLQER